jgi:rod shape-determining protein MreC
MDFFLTRYRSLTALLVAILAQLALLSYQVKSDHEVRLIRVWAVSAVTPVARLLEGGRSGASHFFENYFLLLRVREDDRRLQAELDRVKMENQYLRAQLDTADRARELAIFQAGSPSKTIAARIIGNTTAASAKVVFVDRGSSNGIASGMAVITPNGIVGKVIAVYPTASLVRLITDPAFAAGVVSQKNHVHGTLRGQGYAAVSIDYIQNEDAVDLGEWFYTAGDDLIFPKGLPVGTVSVARTGKARKEVIVTPSGMQNLEDVLIVVEGVHAEIPAGPPAAQSIHLQAPPPAEDGTTPALSSPAQAAPLTTDADRTLEQYRRLGEAQKHVFGERGGGAPNFNAAPPLIAAPPIAGPPNAAPGDSKSGPLPAHP